MRTEIIAEIGQNHNGDMELANEWLRKKGLAASAKKADRIAAEGIVESYIHPGGRVGVLIVGDEVPHVHIHVVPISAAMMSPRMPPGFLASMEPPAA